MLLDYCFLLTSSLFHWYLLPCATVKMVNKCAAFGCRSGYQGCPGIKEDGTKVTFHSFPIHNPELCGKWVRANPRKDFTPTKHSKLCSLHFQPSDFIQEWRDSNAARQKRNAAVSEKPKRVILKDNAVPSVFSNAPTLTWSAHVSSHVGCWRLPLSFCRITLRKRRTNSRNFASLMIDCLRICDLGIVRVSSMDLPYFGRFPSRFVTLVEPGMVHLHLEGKQVWCISSQWRPSQTKLLRRATFNLQEEKAGHVWSSPSWNCQSQITTPSSVLYANQCGGHSRDFWTWLRASGSRNLFTIRSFNTSWEAVGWVLRVRAGLLLVTLLVNRVLFCKL